MPTTHDLTAEALKAGGTFKLFRAGDERLDFFMHHPHPGPTRCFVDGGFVISAHLYFDRDGDYPGGAARFCRPSIRFTAFRMIDVYGLPIPLDMGQARRLFRMTPLEVVAAFKPHVAALLQ